MARTPLFAELSRLFRKAMLAERRHMSTMEFSDRLGLAEETKLSRRKFLLRGAGLVSALSLPKSLYAEVRSRAPKSNSNSGTREKFPSLQSKIPVAIIGAGAAGLTAAYRLYYGMGGEVHPRVIAHVFEASPRIGGRMMTHHTTRGNNSSISQFVEAGGEFIDSDNLALLRLAFELGVPVDRVDSGNLAVTSYFADGARTAEEVAIAFRPLAKIIGEDIKPLLRNPGDFQGQRKTPTKADPLGFEEFDRKNSLAGYLDEAAGKAEQPVPRWLLDLIKVAYIGEFGLEATEQSALNLLTLIGLRDDNDINMFGPSDISLRFVEGTASFIAALARKLPEDTLHVRHRLRAITPRRSGGFVLNFDGRNNVVWADRVVFATPLSTMRNGQIDGLFHPNMPLSQKERDCISAWSYGTSSKLCLGMKERFWRKRPAPGHSTFGSTGNMLTSTSAQTLWDGTEMQGDPNNTPGILTSFLGGKAAFPHLFVSLHATLTALDEIFPEDLVNGWSRGSTFFDNNACLFPWGRMTYQMGGYSCPTMGTYTSHFGVFSNPLFQQPLYFAGEHTSVDYQGFMNGAIESGERVAMAMLNRQERKGPGGRAVDRINGRS